MDKRTQYELEGKVDLPKEINNTWYPDGEGDEIRYVGGFYAIHTKKGHQYIWGQVWLSKEKATTTTVSIREWSLLWGFIPTYKVVSTKQKKKWKQVWKVMTAPSEYEPKNFSNILGFFDNWLKNPAFDTLKSSAVEAHGLRLSNNLIRGVFCNPVYQIGQLYQEIFNSPMSPSTPAISPEENDLLDSFRRICGK